MFASEYGRFDGRLHARAGMRQSPADWFERRVATNGLVASDLALYVAAYHRAYVEALASSTRAAA